MSAFFRRFATTAAAVVGSPWAFLLALGVVVAWGVTGPLFGFSDLWQLAANTGTTIVTFLMVFLIQAVQNRDATAIQLTLDELPRGVEGARTGLADLEDFSDEQLTALHEEFRRRAIRARRTEA